MRILKNYIEDLSRKPTLYVTDGKNFPNKGLHDTAKNNKERVRYALFIIELFLNIEFCFNYIVL